MAYRFGRFFGVMTFTFRGRRIAPCTTHPLFGSVIADSGNISYHAGLIFYLSISFFCLLWRTLLTLPYLVGIPVWVFSPQPVGTARQSKRARLNESFLGFRR